MSTCPSCSREAPEGSRFCPSCASPLDDANTAPTATSLNGAETAAGAPVATDASSYPGSGSGGRFLPGAMVAGRYRIIGLLGRGGMGEVYRADDVKLGQPVALKFLPGGLDQDDGRLRRFLNEARTARQVTHPNVCRVYDIAEVEPSTGSGQRQHFISMEYIDGEDLASLLRRIGRLPAEKATQFARQLCAGLAAAHEQGIVHRDLKPANVMIDGKGRVRITDFGLAGLSEELRGAEAMAGTLPYMAPEQIDGKEATFRSDLYSLGLVLYELYTGKSVFGGRNLAEIRRLQREATPTSMSSMVEHLDPTIESVVLRCLESDPDSRPTSALSVSGALPGGDPLAAALAAGETPSPEMVAAAGDTGAISHAVAARYLAVTIAAFLTTAALIDLRAPHRVMPLELSPPVLENRAVEIVRDFGYQDRPADSAHGFEWNNGYLGSIASDDAETRMRRLGYESPAALQFWYRHSPSGMLPLQSSIFGLYAERITPTDPPPTEPGMISVVLGPGGKLVGFEAVSGPYLAEGQADPFEWDRAFAAAGLDPEAFTETDPVRVPPVASDTRRAWIGAYPEAPEMPLRVEAASLAGKPVWFDRFGPWEPGDNAEFSESRRRSERGRGTAVMILSLTLITIMTVTAWLARRNIRAGRADKSGALRVGAFMFVANLLFWLFHASHLGHIGVDGVKFLGAVAWAGARAFLTSMLFLGIEPYIRRYWPDRIIGWSRLISGRWRDPLVGRDVLAGLAVVSVSSLAVTVISWLRGWPGLTSPDSALADALVSPRYVVAGLLGSCNGAVGNALGMLAILVFLRILVRRPWLATLLWAGLFGTLVTLFQGSDPVASLPGVAIVLASYLLIIHRFGLLAYIVAMYLFITVPVVPVSLDLSVWYSSGTMIHFGLFVALLAWAYLTATRAQPKPGREPSAG